MNTRFILFISIILIGGLITWGRAWSYILFLAGFVAAVLPEDKKCPEKNAHHAYKINE